jgi:hypothetical protein
LEWLSETSHFEPLRLVLPEFFCAATVREDENS